MAPVLLRTFLLALLWTLALPAMASEGELRPGNVRPWVWEHTDGRATADVLLVMKGRADLSRASSLRGKELRGGFVVSELRRVADSSQAAVRAFLDARCTGVVDPADRRALLHGLVHYLGDLGYVGIAQRAPHHGEVLAEDVREPAIDGALAGDDAVPWDALVGQAEVGALVHHVGIPLFKGAGIEQHPQPLPGRELSLFVLCIDAFGAPAFGGGEPSGLERA